MPKCVNGHTAYSLEKCSTCGQQINLEASLDELSEFPPFHVLWKETFVLTVGLPATLANDAHIIQIEKGDKIEETESLFRVKTEGGKTWADVVTENGDRFRNWIRSTGFYCSKRKLVIIDTTDILSPLILHELNNTGNMLVFALSADELSNSLEQNISYVAISALKKRRIPSIICPKSHIDEMPFFIEDKELVFRTATEEITSFFVLHISDLIDITTVDQRLDVPSHYFYAIFSASDIVYPKPESTISFQLRQIQQLVKLEDTQTAHLIARAEVSKHENLVRAFKKIFRGDKNRLVNMNVKLFEKTSEYGLYDLILLLGVKEIYLNNIEAGYKMVVSKNPNLRVLS